FQGVVGSMSVRSSWDSLQKAGVAAREMLIEAAARRWKVDPSQCHAENSAVINPSGARLTYGELAEAAAKVPVPRNPPLKDPKQFAIVGKPVKRLDTPNKVDGKTRFGIDVRGPEMVYAVLARCPVFGGKVASFDASKAKAVPGVKDVVRISNGVAVIATDTWSAMQGRKALEIQWDEGPNASQSSAKISQLLAERAKQPGAVAHKVGDAASAISGSTRKIEAVYEAPFLAHAAMEPLNCTAHVRKGECDVWASTQMQTPAHNLAMKITGFPAEKVRIHTMFMGGGFGRRAAVDFVGEAVEVAKAIGTPVKLTWSREDDMQHDMYRPVSYVHFEGAVDGAGWPLAMSARVACPSFAGLRNGVDGAAVEGLSDLGYGIPHQLVDYRVVDTGIPTFYWRSVGYTQNTFFAESFVDELASFGGKNPIEVRRRLLENSPRMLGVLELAVEKAGEAENGVFGGIALANNVGSYNAQIAEVSIRRGKLKVDRVICAIDCGRVVNPAIVEQQIRSAIVYGLSAALKGKITIDQGRVQQRNFNQYDGLRIDEMPYIEVYIVPSEHAPGGIGEAGVPAIAPAVANAVFAATGKRIRQLPIRAEDLA
ncbi:MAG: xanthine dehydrogenase family protein molybdopterin-binding subunit, partial [Bryobacteraceae bacterium]